MTDLWHTPKPGPGYWDWRCLVCDAAVDAHPSWWRRALRRLRLMGKETAA